MKVVLPWLAFVAASCAARQPVRIRPEWRVLSAGASDVVVVSLDTQRAARWGAARRGESLADKRAYCARARLPARVWVPVSLDRGRRPHWSKLHALLALLDEYEYVAWFEDARVLNGLPRVGVATSGALALPPDPHRAARRRNPSTARGRAARELGRAARAALALGARARAREPAPLGGRAAPRDLALPPRAERAAARARRAARARAACGGRRAAALWMLGTAARPAGRRGRAREPALRRPRCPRRPLRRLRARRVPRARAARDEARHPACARLGCRRSRRRCRRRRRRICVVAAFVCSCVAVGWRRLARSGRGLAMARRVKVGNFRSRTPSPGSGPGSAALPSAAMRAAGRRSDANNARFIRACEACASRRRLRFWTSRAIAPLTLSMLPLRLGLGLRWRLFLERRQAATCAGSHTAHLAATAS